MLRRFLFALLLIPSAAFSQDKAEGWSGRATIYGWLPAIDADVGVDGPRGGRLNGSGSAGIDNVLEALKFAVFVNGELRRGRFGIVGDIVYADLDFDGRSSLGVRRKLGMTSFLGTGLLAWRTWEDDAAWFDLMGGARVVRTKATVSRSGALISASGSSTSAWVDPVIGARGRYPIAERSSVFGLANVGGFGVGSEIAWEAMAGVSYEFNENIEAELAFRYIYMDYESGSLEQTLEMYGPVVGLTFRF